MKRLLLIAMIALPATAFAVDHPSKFEAYKKRLAQRRASALDVRRQYNAAKGPHVYRTAIAVNTPVMTPFIAIEQGRVWQRPIPIRPVVVGYSPYFQPYRLTVQPRANVHPRPVAKK